MALPKPRLKLKLGLGFRDGALQRYVMLRDTTPKKKNQMEKKTENYMEIASYS